MASEHRLPAEFGFSGASPRGRAEHAGTQVGASMAGDREAGQGLVHWGCESQETSSLQACKANCCLPGIFPCRNPELHGEGGPKVCRCGTVHLFSTVSGTSRIGQPGGSLGRRDAALHRGGNLCWVFGAGWHLQPSRSQLARGLEAPNANLPSPLPLFPTRPHAKDPLSAPPA